MFERPLSREDSPKNILQTPALSAEELARLNREEKKELIAVTSGEVLEFLRAHAVEYKDVNELYKVLRGETLIVRRESPERILSALEDNKALVVDFPDGQRYSNAVLWNPEQGSRGIDNAYLEGYGQANGVVTVMGVRADAVDDVVALEDASQRFAGLDRAYVRSVQGEVAPEAILFVSVRIPAFAFPEAELTDAERERLDDAPEKPQFIHRGFLFTEHLTKQ